MEKKSKDKLTKRERLAELGQVRRALVGAKPTADSKKLGKRIANLASKEGLIVEWTLRPQNLSESVGVGCGCFCGCGCSCIA